MNCDPAVRLERHGPLRTLTVVAIVFALLSIAADSALAGAVSELDVASNTTAMPGGTHDYAISVLNVGDAPTPDSDADGVADEPRILNVSLPPGITVAAASAPEWDCSGLVPGASVVSCSSTAVADPSTHRSSFVSLQVSIAAGALGVRTAAFTVTGGGAAPASTVDQTLITPSPPAFGVDAFDGQVADDASGMASTRAGAHPYAITTAIFFNTLTNPIPNTGSTWPVEPVKDVFVDLPPGFVGAPTATGEALCTVAQLSNAEGTNAKPLCPPGAQVGVTKVFTAEGQLIDDTIPVFNMVPPPSAPARFGFDVAGTVVTFDATLRSGTDYGLSVNVLNVSEGLALAGTILTFWGTPADPSHDGMRACPGQTSPGNSGPSCTTELPRRAFLRNPTSCTVPGVGLNTKLRVDSWFNPGEFKTVSYTSHDLPAFPFPAGAQVGIGNCADVPFEPKFSGAPSPSGTVGEPSAFAFDLHEPQSDDPDQVASSDLKKAVVNLPVGVRVSPSSASGLGACSPAQIQLHSASVPTCPGASKIGTMTITTPLLKDELTGSIYLAKPHDNPFGSLLAVYLVAKGPGVVVKLPGRVEADAVTGQLSAAFDDNPQLPFSDIHLEFAPGPRAPLVNPRDCGSYQTRAVLTSWSGASVTSDSTFEVSRDGNGAACGPPQFSPAFAAGVNSVKAGKHTSFALRLSREDQDQELGTLSVSTPQGLLAKVAGVPLCRAVPAAAGTCTNASRVGSVLTGAGAGPNPFYLPGRVYLTGPYKGGPFGLSIVVPAIAGPFDLGDVVVRASIQVDRHTAQLRVVSDPLPRILQGIPLQIRDVRVKIDRSKFMLDPTSCAQKRVTATVGSTGGMTAHLADRFQVGGCSKLPLRPKLTLTVGGKGHTKKGASTPLTAVLTQTPDQANLRSVSVSLPLPLNALLNVVNDACTQVQFDAGHCEQARAGSAMAITPLLKHGLRGGVYFVKDPKKPTGSLPNLVVALRGQVDFDLVGTITIPGGTRLATDFKAVPDVPIKKFVLSLVSGSRGAIGTAANLCSTTARGKTAAIVFRGQNGAVIHRDERLRVRGCGRQARH